MQIIDFVPIGTVENGFERTHIAEVTVITGHWFWRDSSRCLIVRSPGRYWRFADTGEPCPRLQCEDAEAAYEARIAIEKYRDLLEDAESKTQPNE